MQETQAEVEVAARPYELKAPTNKYDVMCSIIIVTGVVLCTLLITRMVRGK